jgi:predicted TPR repeat methyltransferase
MDLSPGMLRQAARTDVYDALVEAELVAFMSERDGAFDAIVLADTLVYFGGLEQALAAATNALRPQGCLVFTLERATASADDAGFAIQSSGRYRHSQIYVERTLHQAGFICRRIDVETLRQERGKSVAGLVITAIRCCDS